MRTSDFEQFRLQILRESDGTAKIDRPLAGHFRLISIPSIVEAVVTPPNERKNHLSNQSSRT